MKFKFPSRNTFAFSLSTAFVLGFLTSAVAFARQILVAGFFGAGGEMDVYFMVFAIATFLALTPGTVFQNAVVPRLVQVREKGVKSEFARLAGAVIILSLIFSACICLLFSLIGPLAVHFFAPGFDDAKKSLASGLAIHFLPWIMLASPYNALGAVLKSSRRYVVPLVGELLLTLVSAGCLYLRHNQVSDIAFAYFFGHAAASLWMVVSLFWVGGIQLTLRVEGLRIVLRNMAELYGSMQVGVLAGAVDRVFQSYLAAGGMAALGYAGQLSNAISGLLGFKQIYVVPLSSAGDRAVKLERLLTGLLFLTLPVTLFISINAHPIVEFLYHRGKFDGAAVSQTAGILSILSFGILTATLNAPMSRMYQVLDRIKLNGVIQMAAIVNFLAFGWLFQFILDMGARGLALAVVLNSCILLFVQLWLLWRSGLVLDLARLGNVAARSIGSNAIMVVGVSMIFGRPKGQLTELLLVGGVWVVATLIVYALNWRTLKWALKA
jgi:putative peptidoglycan lipid II flippase